jgi:hypothetical protein
MDEAVSDRSVVRNSGNMLEILAPARIIQHRP